jgi:SRSO17 transposase
MRLHMVTTLEDLMIDDLVQQPPVALELPDVQLWNVYWGHIQRRIAPIFARSDSRERAMAYLAGLLSGAERKNSWQLAEICGHANPYAFQHLLGRADWDPDALRDRLRSYITDFLADDGAIGVLDETGFLKKGHHSAGVARQYSGTAGRIENCQIGVFLSYATSRGHTLLDRELYLPKEWTDDPERCKTAGIPEQRAFATKPALARQMLQHAFDAGVKLAYVTGDSVYGDDHALRTWLEERQQPYVLARSCNEYVWIGHTQHTIASILAELPQEGWVQLSAGAGSKGERLYEWRGVLLHPPAERGWRRWLLFRRSLSQARDVAAYTVFAPAHMTLTSHVQAAGTRWTVEESIQDGKGEVGLDHYEVRSWTGWYRHITLCMAASAVLAVIRAESGAEIAPKKGLCKPERESSLARFKARRNLQSP